MDYFKHKEITKDKLKKFNYLFEGENLDFLGYLKDNYLEKIDFIYIDPPYNTGKNFIYKDKKDNWNQFMVDRLKIAYELMKDKAFLFISIDDYSFADLKLICDSIFKNKYFKRITPFIRRTSTGGRNSSSFTSAVHDYVLVYQKNISEGIKGLVSPNVPSTNYPLEDSRGVYKLRSMKRDNSNKNTGMNYDLVNPSTGKVHNFELGWRWSKDKVDWGIKNNYIVFKDDKDGKSSVYFKEYRDFDNEGNPIIRKTNIESILENYPNSLGTNDLKNVLGTKKCPFDNPKPVDLIKYLIKISDLDKNSIILDFFAGSGTTGQAVMELNKEDGGNRQFILCTNNENKICEEITYKRIENCINGYRNLKNEIVNGLNENLIYYKKNRSI